MNTSRVRHPLRTYSYFIAKHKLFFNFYADYSVLFWVEIQLQSKSLYDINNVD